MHSRIQFVILIALMAGTGRIRLCTAQPRGAANPPDRLTDELRATQTLKLLNSMCAAQVAYV